MPNVRIDITGTGSSGGGVGGNDNRIQQPNPQPQPQPDPSRQTAPPDSRLMDELRRMLIEQASGVRPNDHYTPLITQLGQMQRQQLTQQYDARRQQAQDTMTRRYADIDRQVDESIDREVYERGVTDDDQIQREVIDKWEERRNRLYQEAGTKYDEEIAQIEEEQTQKEEELTRVIEELTEQIRKSGGQLNPNSYLSQLREERQRAIVERDTAEDEETARAAGQRVRELDQQIRSVERGESTDESDNNDVNWGLRTIQTMMGFDQLARGIMSRDLGSIIMGVGQTATSMFGMSDRGAARALAWIKPIATVGTMLTQEAQKSDQMAGLAALIRNDSQYGGGTIRDTRAGMYMNLWNYAPNGSPVGIYDMGLSVPEFAAQAQSRIRQRGIMSGGISEAYFQEALERVFSLNQGALGQAGRYDRYGTNMTDALSMLIDRLSRISNSGVSQGNYVRAQEYLDMQQALMQQYMQFQNNPNVGIANKEISAFAQLRNYTVDSRTAGEIGAVRGMITNPQNDRMKAILYSTVEEMNPEYAGRSDLIDQAINDPLKQGAIIRNFMQRIQSMYGGFDTPMGYWAARSALPNVAVGRLRQIWEGIANGQAGAEFANGKVTMQDFSKNPINDTGEKVSYAAQVQGYSSELNQVLLKASDGIYAGVSAIENFANDVVRLLTQQMSLLEFLKNRI